MTSPRTQYARCGDVDIAFQVLGDGPIDLLLFTPLNIPIECMDEEPSLARFQRRLASFARVVRFDRRGVGLSDRGSLSDPPTLDHWVLDSLAVLDAVGSARAAVLASSSASPPALMLAAMHPERVAGLVLVNGYARVAWAPDYPLGYPAEILAAALRRATDTDAVDQGIDVVARFAPSIAHDQAFRNWWDRAGNLGASPGMTRAMQATLLEVDVRDVLAQIKTPTLILQRAGVRPALGPYVADNVAGARYVEFPGVDQLYWVGDTRPMLDEIEEFITGARGGSGAERVLTTVLFTDIVGSTDRAALLGDRRWRDLLDRHDQTVRTQLERFGGHEVKTVGDGFIATFDSPGRAIECALAVRGMLKASDIDVRAGIHTGEIEVRGDDVAGMAVHIGARVSALAGPSEVLVSSTVKDLVVGSSVEFDERGEHDLKGVPGTWRLFAVRG